MGISTRVWRQRLVLFNFVEFVVLVFDNIVSNLGRKPLLARAGRDDHLTHGVKAAAIGDRPKQLVYIIIVKYYLK